MRKINLLSLSLSCIIWGSFIHLGLVPLPPAYLDQVMASGPIFSTCDTIACGDSLVLDAGTGWSTITWSTGANTQTITVTSSGTYWVDVTDAMATPFSDTMRVQLVPVPAPPTGVDTFICGPGLAPYLASGSGDTLIWYNNANGDSIIGAGSPLFVPLTDTTTYYAATGNFVPVGSAGKPDKAPGSSQFFSPAGVGLEFDVLAPLVIDSVSVFTASPNSTVVIELKDSQNTLLASTSMVIPLANTKTSVPLGFFVLPGTDYRLVSGTSVSLTRNTSGIAFPYVLPGYISITNSVVGSSTFYHYFYDWKISGIPCPSPLAPVKVDVIPPITSSLGQDTTVCGDSLLLDASFPGATYLWGTGETTPTFTVSGSGTYDVRVSVLACTKSDTVSVVISPPPPAPAGIDSMICGPGVAPFLGIGMGDQTYWYDSPARDSLVGAGDTLMASIVNTTTLYAETGNYEYTGNVGPPDRNVGGSQFFNASGVGIEFDVFTPLILDSVAVFTNTANTTVVIELKDSQNNVLASVSELIPTGNVKTNVSLGFEILPGNSYRLTSGSAVQMSRNTSGVAFPYELPGLIRLNQSVVGTSTFFHYFYDWQISTIPCPSPLTPVTVMVIPPINLDFGQDTIVCNDSLRLNGFNSGATYLWGTGDTTPSYRVDSTGTYTVAVTVGQCTKSDTIGVVISPIPNAPAGVDTFICGSGPATFIGSGTGEEILWFDSPTRDSLVGVGDTLVSLINTNTTYYASSGNYEPVGAVGAPSPGIGSFQFFNPAGVGLEFDVFQAIILDSVSVFTSSPGSNLTVQLLDSNNTILDEAMVTVPFDNTLTAIPLGFQILPGTGYKLVSGTSVSMARNTSGVAFPYELPGLIRINQSVLGTSTFYHFFYNWQVSAIPCPSPLEAVTVTIVPPIILDLGRDTVVCADSVQLDVTNAGATYLWNTNDTTPTLTIDSSGVYSVSISTAFCDKSDTLGVILSPPPTSPTNVQDQTSCFPSILTFTADGDGNDFVWYDQPSGGNIIAFGDSIELFFPGTDTLYVETGNFVPKGDVGISAPGAGSQFFNVPSLGLEFNVLKPLFLDSVKIESSTTGFLDINLLDSMNRVVNSLRFPVTFTDTLINVPVGFLIPPGNRYKLVKTDVLNLRRTTSGTNFPYVLSDVIEITQGNASNPNFYQYFYDWHVSTIECPSPRVRAIGTITVGDAIPDSIYSCGAVTLDAGNAGSTYLWNTNQTSQAITTDTSGVFSVSISKSGCVYNDTVIVEIPSIPLGPDGTLCGRILDAGNPGSDFLWSTGDTTQTIILNGPGVYSVQVDNPFGCTLFDTINVVAFDTFPTPSLGPDFADCISADLDLGNIGSTYLWSTGDTTQMITVNSTGIYWGCAFTANGCEGCDTIAVSLSQLPSANFTINQLTAFQFCFANLSTFGTFLWNFGDGTTSTSVSPCHTYLDGGDYTVCLIVTNQCGADTFKQTITSVSTDAAFEAPTFEVFPNPAKEELFIGVDNLTNLKGEITIFDYQGRLVREVLLSDAAPAEIRIDVHSWSRGIYVVRFRQGKTIQTKKIILE